MNRAFVSNHARSAGTGAKKLSQPAQAGKEPSHAAGICAIGISVSVPKTPPRSHQAKASRQLAAAPRPFRRHSARYSGEHSWPPRGGNHLADEQTTRPMQTSSAGSIEMLRDQIKARARVSE
jgi:hypothetical protein